MYPMMILFFENFIMIVGVLISVAFITLYERKILGYIQIRKGPNKLMLMGIFQPFSDALKLFSKENILLEVSNYWLYYFCSMFSLVLMLMMWTCIPFFGGFLDMNFGVIIFLCFLSMGVYSLLGMGWSSNSAYSLLGAMRSVAQTISYEVSFALIIISNIIFIESYNLSSMTKMNMIFVIFVAMILMWWFSLIAELNRTPFDFSEGESELVSGFNIEYAGSAFAMIFMSEYGMIIFLALMTSLLFFKINLWMCILASSLIILLRGSYPRYRYDKLMSVAWKILLPSIIIMIMFHFYVLTWM